MEQLLITEDLIEQKLTEYGFGDEAASDHDSMLAAVCKCFDAEISEQYSTSDFYLYEDESADGYTLYVATNDPDRLSVNRDVHQYEYELSNIIKDNIRASHKLYVEDMNADYFIEAINELFEEVQEDIREQIIDDLREDGYIMEDDIEDED
jgi:hypothetical protein